MLKRTLLNLLNPRRRRIAAPGIHTAAAVRYKTRILNPDGSVASERAFKNNLILDQGLNNVAAQTWWNLFEYCAIGTGTTAVKRDSGLTTFTRTGTTVTASANFFEAGDVGRLFKFDTGEEMYMTAYTDPQNVTVGTSGSIGAAEGTVWYVNQTGLTTEAKRTNTTSGGATENKSTFSVDTYTHQRQFLFDAEVGSVTYREIGWSHTASAPNLFGRDVIPGAGDSLTAGQQYQVIVTLILTIAPASIITAPDVGTGWDSAGTINHQYIGNQFSTANTPSLGIIEPAGGPGPAPTYVGAVSAGFSLNAGISTGVSGFIAGDFVTCSRSSYSAGTFTRTLTATFSVSQALYEIKGFQWGYDSRGLMLLLDTPFTKDNLHTLSTELTLTWGRTLTN